MGGDCDDTRQIKLGSEKVCEINTSFLDLAPLPPFHSTLALSAFAPACPVGGLMAARTTHSILPTSVSAAGHGLITNHSNRSVVEELLHYDCKSKSLYSFSSSRHALKRSERVYFSGRREPWWGRFVEVSVHLLETHVTPDIADGGRTAIYS
jgi:hypothetical protein